MHVNVITLLSLSSCMLKFYCTDSLVFMHVNVLLYWVFVFMNLNALPYWQSLSSCMLIFFRTDNIVFMHVKVFQRLHCFLLTLHPSGSQFLAIFCHLSSFDVHSPCMSPHKKHSSVFSYISVVRFLLSITYVYSRRILNSLQGGQLFVARLTRGTRLSSESLFSGIHKYFII
jgi:hypothetical protein